MIQIQNFLKIFQHCEIKHFPQSDSYLWKSWSDLQENFIIDVFWTSPLNCGSHPDLELGSALPVRTPGQDQICVGVMTSIRTWLFYFKLIQKAHHEMRQRANVDFFTTTSCTYYKIQNLLSNEAKVYKS